MAAGALITKEAGGRISLCDGGNFDLYQENILATNAQLHDARRIILNSQ